jgi:hypothetical protein
VRPVHGSTVDRSFKMKGYVIQVIRARSNGPGRVRAGCGGGVAGERRRVTGARRRWPWLAIPATSTTKGSSKCRGDVCARVRGVYGGYCASPAAGTGRGRSGHSGELAGTLLCTKRRENWAGKIAHSSRVKRASSKVKKIQQRRGLATAAGRAALRRGRGACH